MLQSDILDNGTGNCVIIGDLSGLNTSAFAEGAQLYLSGVTAGTYTDTKILAPTHLVYVGKVTRSHPTQGQIEVGIQNGYEISEIHDIAINGLADKQLLSYDTASGLWKNKSVTTADIADSTDKRYCTDAQKTVISNTSGTNTGDQDLTNLVVKNTAIVGATKPKITFDAKGLVTAGSDLIASDIPTIAQSQVTNLTTDLAGKQPLLSYTPYKFIHTRATAHTGTVAETIITTATINGGTFNSTDVIKVMFGANKSATATACTQRIRINTTNTIDGSVIIAGMNTTTANAVILKRNFVLNGGNLYGVQFSLTNTITDEATVLTSVYNNTPFNTANTLYLFFTVTLGNVADSVIPNLCNITN